MKIIDGIIVTSLKIIQHEKGNIYHAIRNDSPGFLEFGEAYFSTIKYNEIKAWKKHSKMTLNLVVPIGKVKFVFYDDRKGSNTFGLINEFVLSINNYNRLTIPPNIWMGFQGLGGDINLVLNIANILHDPKEQINSYENEFLSLYCWGKK